MKIDLSEIVSTPGMTARMDLEDTCPKDLGFTCTAPVKGHMTFNNTGTLLVIGGDFKTEVKLECSRCLIDFTEPVESEIEEVYRVEKVGDAMQALPLEDEDISAGFIHNNILDVQELIRQGLLTALPIQPLCTPGCEGLCPTCGENLNMRKCQCPPAEPESPFKALASLLEDEEKDK
jgi:uncharacterized protein